MYRGTVKWFDKVKGYGFIDYKGNDIFVHVTQVESGSLVDGEIVELEIVPTQYGYRAKNVKSLAL